MLTWRYPWATPPPAPPLTQTDHDVRMAYGQGYEAGYEKGKGKGFDEGVAVGWQMCTKDTEANRGKNRTKEEADEEAEWQAGSNAGKKRKGKSGTGQYAKWMKQYYEQDPPQAHLPRIQVWTDCYWAEFLEKYNNEFRDERLNAEGTEVRQSCKIVVELSDWKYHVCIAGPGADYEDKQALEQALKNAQRHKNWDSRHNEMVIGWQQPYREDDVSEDDRDKFAKKFRAVRMVSPTETAEVDDAGGFRI